MDLLGHGRTGAADEPGDHSARRPLWTPGTAHGYHGRTWGRLIGEVIRRVSGRTPGRFFADEIAASLGLDFFVGLSADERDRASRMVRQRPHVDLTAVPTGPVPGRSRLVGRTG